MSTKLNNKLHRKNKKNQKCKQKYNHNLNNVNSNTKLTKKNTNQKGGNNSNISNIKEKFEVRSLKDFDYSKYKISNYIKNADVDWGILGGPPPEPDCTIL
jgi:hypothetical protein